MGYPKAALFGFCIALLAYNVLALVKAALRRVHDEEKIADEVSGYYLAGHLARTYDGMMITIPNDEWLIFQDMSSSSFIAILQQLASKVDLAKFRKHKRGRNRLAPPCRARPGICPTERSAGCKTKLIGCARIASKLGFPLPRPASGMYLSDHDLRQLDEAALARLEPEQVRALLIKALEDLKAARERLAQNPTNSSRPPSTRAPWEQAEAQGQEPEEAPVASAQGADEVKPPAVSAPEPEEKKPQSSPEDERAGKPTARPGRRKGAPGHSRTQQLPVNAEEVHAPSCCAICGHHLDDAHEQRAHNARCVLDLVPPAGGGSGLVVQQTKHIYLERRCPCGHWSRALPGRCDEDERWTVPLSEWHLAGPTLVAFICALTQRMRLSRAKVREFLSDWLGLSLSTALINQCVHEAARAVEPVVEQEILTTVRNVELAYADETSWKERGKLLWLWVFTCATATLFIVGRRSREMVQRVLGEGFGGWLMSDGYWAYRELDQRLRCLPHIIRKARALEEGFDAEGRALGRQVLDVIATVMQAVYEARGGPPQGGLRERHAPMLKGLLEHCLRLADARHEKTRALARELLNDWDTFWVVLDHPQLPLSNNEAERALRHWVIARRIGMGTRTSQGTRAFALLASVIETCRKRGVSPWPYLAEVIRQRRKGLPAPPMPAPAV